MAEEERARWLFEDEVAAPQRSNHYEDGHPARESSRACQQQATLAHLMRAREKVNQAIVVAPHMVNKQVQVANIRLKYATCLQTASKFGAAPRSHQVGLRNKLPRLVTKRTGVGSSTYAA